MLRRNWLDYDIVVLAVLVFRYAKQVERRREQRRPES